MKKIVALLLVLCLSVCFSSAFIANSVTVCPYDNCVEMIEYDIKTGKETLRHIPMDSSSILDESYSSDLNDPLPYIEPRNIIGTDDRKRADTNLFPYNSIVNIIAHYTDATSSFTGCFIGPNTILTCAHGLYHYEGSNHPYSVEIYPARDADNKPYGVFYASTVAVTQNWTTNTNRLDNDYAILKIDEPIGKKTGWMSITTSVGIGNSVTVSGYHGGLTPNYAQWYGKGTVKSMPSGQLQYDCDTTSGSSGSPVFNANNEIVGVNTYSSTPYNGGVRITNTLISTIRPYLREDYKVTSSGLIDGGTYYIKNNWQNKYITLPGANASDGNKIQVQPFNGSVAQKWRVMQNSDGTFRIVSMVNQGYSLDVRLGLDQNENYVQLWANNYNVNSKFRISYTSNGLMRITPAFSSTRCLDVYGGSDSSKYGNAVQIYTTSATAVNQQWTFEPADGVYYIKNVQFSKYLDVPDGDTADGRRIQVVGYNGSKAQQWRLSRNTDGTYKIISMANENYSIDIRNAYDDDGAYVQLWTNNYNINSKFNITTVNGVWQIRPAFSTDKGLDVDFNGANRVQLWTLNGVNKNQHWIFEPVY